MSVTFNKLFGLHSLKNRVVAGYMLVISIFLLLVLYSYYSISRINDIHLLKEHSLKLQTSLAEIKCASSQFILNDRTNLVFFETGSSPRIENYNRAYASFTSTLDKTIELSESFNNNTVELKKLKRDIEDYNNNFNLVKAKMKERGFDKYGIVGDFEKAMIQLMQYDFGVDNVVLSNMELYVKNYLLTGDTNTVKGLETELYSFSMLLEKHIRDDKIDVVANLLNNYSETFNKMVAIDNQLGRNFNEGLEKKLFLMIVQIDENLKKENKAQEEFYKKLNKNIFRIYVLMIVAAIGIALTISLYLSRIIIKPINAIREDILKIGKGDIPEKVKISDMKEIGEMAMALNNVIDGLKEKATFADSIGKGKFDAHISIVNEKDVLTCSLIGMRDNLKKVEEENQQRNWTTVGNAKFMELLRTNENNLKEMSNLVISNLVKYLNANQGGLFLINNDKKENPFIELMACYAYERKKFINQQIAIGEGLIGQCVLEKESIFLTEVPENYLKITSGLGDALPRCIFIVPLKMGNEIYGALELASFTPFEKYQREFIEKLSETIAASVSSVKINERTKQLLEETQHMTASMKSQEEQMRQNLEELIATQEELQRREQELLNEVSALKNKK